MAEFEQELTDDGYAATDELTEADFNYTTSESDQGQDHDEPSEVTDAAHLVTTLPPERRCRTCCTSFTSRNKLFKHIYANSCTRPVVAAGSKNAGTDRPTVIDAEPEPATKNYTYIKMPVQFPGGSTQTQYQICVDTGCSRPLVDRQWLSTHPSHTVDHNKSIVVKAVGQTLQLDGKANIQLLVPGHLNGKPATGRVNVSAWITDHLEPLLLLGNEFLEPHGAIIDLPKRQLTIGACQNMTVPIELHRRDPVQRRRLLASSTVTIPPQSLYAIPTRTRDEVPDLGKTAYMLCGDYPGTLDAIIDHTAYIVFKNDSNKPKTISVNTVLAHLEPYQEDGYYEVSTPEDIAFLAHKFQYDTDTAYTTNLDDNTSVLTRPHPKANPYRPGSGISKVTQLPEITTPNGIHIYAKDPDYASALEQLINHYTQCWQDHGPVNVPEDQRMQIPLVEGWQTQRLASKPYPLGRKDREAVDKTFDELHRKGLIE